MAKHHLLPDKYRPLAYLSLLKLPISPASFRNLESKGLHDCVQFLDSKYPLANQSLADKLKKIVSLLAHLHSIFSEAETVPSIVFPLVCLFGNDEFLCF